MELEEIKHQTIRSIIALQGRTILLQTISLVSFLFLGIFLSPSAVGIFISVSALQRIFTFFTDLGLGAALVQKKEEIDDLDLKTTFTIQEIIMVLIVAIGLVITPNIARFANLDSNGTNLYIVLVITLFISSLKAIPSILLERKLAFEKQVIPQIFESLAFNIIVVALAYKGFGVASYSWAILTSALIGLPIYYYLSPWKIAFGISLPHAKKLFSYGLAYQGKNVLAVIKDDLLTFFLARLVGTAGVGYWGWAQRWAYSPFRLVVDSVTKVTFPAYARIQHDKEALKSGIEKSLFAVSVILFPILAIFSVLIGKIIPLIPRYEKWQPALPSFYFLAAGAAVSGLSNILVNALDATGRVKTTLGLMIIWIILTWGLTLSLIARFGFSGVAAASFLVTLTIVVTIKLVKKIVPFSFLGSIWQPVFSTLVMLALLFFLSAKLPTGYLSLVLLATVGVIIYVGILVLTAKNKLTANIQTILRAYGKT